MKICLISLRALPALSDEHKHERIGGEEVQHSLLAKALVRLGYDVRLVVGDFGQADGAVYEGVTTLKAYEETAGIPGLRFFPRWARVWAAMSRADADVYYYSCAGMILGLAAMFCTLHGRRLVFRIARDDDCDINKVELRFQRDRWLYQYGLKRTNAVLVQTRTQQRDLEKNFGLHSVVAGMLVETRSPFSSAKDIDVLWVANIRKAKRPDRMLELARAMPGIKFHMAGGPVPGEEALYHQIEAEARSISNLTFHGGTPYRGIGQMFDRAKVFANTSELEGFPNTFLQSWVRGIPVVTTFDPDGVVKSEGLGSSHSNVAEMVEGLTVMMSDTDAYQVASDAAIAFMERNFGEGDVLKPYIAALEGSAGTAAMPSERDSVATTRT